MGESSAIWQLKRSNVSFRTLTGVNVKTIMGYCPLHHAVECENIEALKLLLQTPNLDVNQTNDLGSSAVHFAVKYSNEALKLLLNVPNIDVNIVEAIEQSAVSLAVDY